MNDGLSVKQLASGLASKQRKRDYSKLTQRLRKLVHKRLAQLTYGQLVIFEGSECYQFNSNKRTDIRAEIVINDPQFYWFISLGGSVGAGEAFINQYWESPNLTQVIQLFAVNQQVMDSMEGGLAKITSPLKKLFHWLNKNTQQGSKKNIVAHYDLGNPFFSEFLDPTMMYSAGIFKHHTETMQQASENKLQRICEKLRLTESDHVIEIGTGWAGFAIYAAKNFGCKVTTTTISEEQYQYAQQAVAKAGLTEKITLLKKDYRLLTGKYDKLVSIEMVEAVGHQFYDIFFKQCANLLKAEGEMLIQAITIADQRFEAAKNDVDFIKRYIFPGSCIPSVTALNKSITKATDMRMLDLFDMGVDYALTLEKWRLQFFHNLEKIRQQGFDDNFIRMWHFYLCYCEGGFRERVISDVQLHLVKPMARVPMHFDS
ncbi:class I SAM-dependent methyltransferase [Aliikangiella sp. IMCC44632]